MIPGHAETPANCDLDVASTYPNGSFLISPQINQIPKLSWEGTLSPCSGRHTYKNNSAGVHGGCLLSGPLSPLSNRASGHSYCRHIPTLLPSRTGPPPSTLKGGPWKAHDRAEENSKMEGIAERKHYILSINPSSLHIAPVASLLKELSVTGRGSKERSLEWRSEVDLVKSGGESYFPYVC